jgi:hypothetical protein
VHCEVSQISIDTGLQVTATPEMVATGAVSVMVAVADFAASATLVAVSVTVLAALIAEGAV